MVYLSRVHKHSIRYNLYQKNELSEGNLLRTYYQHLPSYEPVRELETINLTEFNLKTASDIIHLGCAVGPVDCKDAWKTLLTPQGACSVLELSNSQTLGLNYTE